MMSLLVMENIDQKVWYFWQGRRRPGCLPGSWGRSETEGIFGRRGSPSHWVERV